MANKLNFKPEEWATLLESARTMVAGIAVSAAGPKWCVGEALKEFLATAPRSTPRSSIRIQTSWSAEYAPTLRNSRAGRASSRRRYSTGALPRWPNPADFVQHSLITLREASAILDARESPHDAAAFKAWLFGVSRAEGRGSRHRKAGFSALAALSRADAERATLDDLARRSVSPRHTPGSKLLEENSSQIVVDDPPVRERVVGNPALFRAWQGLSGALHLCRERCAWTPA